MAENIIEKAKRYRAYLEKAVTSLSDEDALEVPSMFKKWGPDMVVEEGDRLYYAPNKTLYKVKPGQGHTTQSDWRPDITPALYEPVVLGHAGTLEDPIPAIAGMTYVKDLYYLDGSNGKTYICIRQDTAEGTVLHYLPHDLVGNYFNVVE